MNKNKLFLKYILAIVAVALGGCGGSSSDARVTALEIQVATLAEQMSATKKEMDDLKAGQQIHELIRNSDNIAFLTPGEQGYSVIKFDLGYLTVSLEDIREYANGSKVRLRFGNLTSAKISGLKAKLEWGTVDEKGMPKNEIARSRQIAFNEDLRSGSWTNTEVVLDGVPPSEFGFLRLRDVGHRGIVLSGG